MKFNIKKIVSVLASAAMIGSSLGFAAAAYPAPFVSGGSADVAIVYGSNAQPTDYTASIDIGTNLGNSVATSIVGGAPTGGDSYLFEKSSTKWQMGLALLDVVSVDLTDSDLPTLLADGMYIDNDNDEFDFEQKLDIGNMTLTMFEDSDYKQDVPTVGIKITNNAYVLNYTMDFIDKPLWSDLTTSNMNFMGKKYYVSSITANTTINLLDSAFETILAEGETTSLNVGGKTYDVSINFIGTTSVKLIVNSETTNSLSSGETQKLSDGAYVGIKEISVQDYAGGIKQVEFSIGSGKLTLKNNEDVKINENAITGLKTILTNDGSASSGGDQLGKIVLKWTASDDLFITEESQITMPGFESVKFSFTGLYLPKEEVIKVKPSSDTYVTLDDFPLKDATVDIDLLYRNASSWIGLGKDNDNRLLTSFNKSMTFDDNVHDYFVASYNDGSNAESYLMRFSSFAEDTSASKNTTTIQYVGGTAADGSVTWTNKKTGATKGDSISIGNVELTLGRINKNDKSIEVIGGTNVEFNTLYSREGMKVFLPWINITNVDIANAAPNLTAANCSTYITGPARAGGGQIGSNITLIFANDTDPFYGQGAKNWGLNESRMECVDMNYTTYNLTFSEEDKNGNIASGFNISAILSKDSNNKASVEDVERQPTTNGVSAREEIDDTDVFRSFVLSALGTELLEDESNDREEAKLIYHGDESYGKVYISSDLTSFGGGTTGAIVPVRDSEVSSASGKNLIVVGGSCINTVAAKLLGSNTPLCEGAWTSTTGVSSGEYLIQTFANPYSSGKVATLVAGYEAADTMNAGKALTTGTIEVSTGKKYKGTTSSNAALA